MLGLGKERLHCSRLGSAWAWFVHSLSSVRAFEAPSCLRLPQFEFVLNLPRRSAKNLCIILRHGLDA